MDDRDVARAVEVRVGIHGLGGSVRGPTGVADPAVKPLGAARHSSFRAATDSVPDAVRARQVSPRAPVRSPLSRSRDTPGASALEKRRQRVLGSYDPNNAAHSLSLLGPFWALSELFTGGRSFESVERIR